MLKKRLLQCEKEAGAGAYSQEKRGYYFYIFISALYAVGRGIYDSTVYGNKRKESFRHNSEIKLIIVKRKGLI